MAEPMEGYCVDPATELQDAHDLVHGDSPVAEPEYTSTEKLMKPNTSGDPLTGE